MSNNVSVQLRNVCSGSKLKIKPNRIPKQIRRSMQIETSELSDQRMTSEQVQ